MITTVRKLALIKRFRDICLKLHPEDIDTLTENDRHERLGFVTPANYSMVVTMGLGDEPNLEICRLAKTPRLLKHIFRRTYQTWDRLHGEIDFDDLFIANVLRYAAPGSFMFIIENFNEKRGLQRDSTLKKSEERLKDLEAKWSQITGGVAWDSTSAQHLIQFIFPTWKFKYYHYKKSKYQGLAVDNPTDYWLRFLDEELTAEVFRDQEIIRGLTEWKNNADGLYFRNQSLTFVLCESDDFTKKFEHFAELTLNGFDIRRIAAAIFSEAIKLHGVATHKDSVPGFIPLRECATRQPIDEKEHLNWVQEQIFKALPLSLRFANDIYYYWKSNSEMDVHNKVKHEDLRRAIVSQAKILFANNPLKYLKVLDPNHISSSCDFSVNLSSPEEGGEGFVPADWLWYFALLLDAGDLDPQVIMPQVAYFLFKGERHIDGYKYSFNMDFAEKIFGPSLNRLMQLLSQTIDLTQFDHEETKLIQLVRDVALNWIAEHNKLKNA